MIVMTHQTTTPQDRDTKAPDLARQLTRCPAQWLVLNHGGGPASSSSAIRGTRSDTTAELTEAHDP